MPEPVIAKKKTREQIAKEYCKEIYSHAVRRVVEISEEMKPAPDPSVIKKMLQRRFAISVEATEIFMDNWQAIGKGRFAPKDE